jgi:hypothetical protein
MIESIEYSKVSNCNSEIIESTVTRVIYIQDVESDKIVPVRLMDEFLSTITKKSVSNFCL